MPYPPDKAFPLTHLALGNEAEERIRAGAGHVHGLDLSADMRPAGWA